MNPRRPLFRRNAQSGFTLIEVLLASVVLAAGLALVVRSIAAAHVGAISAARTYRSSVLLNERAELLFAEAALGEGLATGESSGAEEGPGGPYRWRMVSVPDDAVYAVCDLTVAWSEGARERHVAAKLYLERAAAGS